MNISVLRSISLFADISDEDLEVLTAYAKTRQFAEGETLLHYGDRGFAAYVILSGTVKVHRATSLNAEVTIAVRGPGECVGELSIIDEDAVSASITAFSAVNALELRSSSLRAALQASPSLSWAVLQSLSRRLREASDMIEALATKPAAQRLAGVIAAIAEQHGERIRTVIWPAAETDPIKISLKLTMTDLANIVGNSREQVSKAFSRLRRTGIVSRDPRDRKIVVFDIDRLKEFSSRP